MQKWVKISPKKCQLFKTELQYMGNTIFLKDRRVCVKPLRCRLEAIQKLKHPMTVKGCRSFAGMVNFVSIFCPELQELLKPIYDLTRKGRHFIWEEEQNPQFYICQIEEVDFCYILTQANMPLVVPCTKFRMVSPNLLHTLVNECQK